MYVSICTHKQPFYEMGCYLWGFTCKENCSVTQSCLTLCDPVDCSMPSFPVLHQNPELTQTHVGDAIQSSHPLLSPSPPTFDLSQHQGLFQLVSSSHQVAKLLEFQLQHQSFQWYSGLISFRIDWLALLAVQGTLRVSSKTTVQNCQFFSTQLSLQPSCQIHTWLLGKS